jgi:hypothetical protein
MSATPLTEIRLPRRAIAELRDIDVTAWIDNHATDVGRSW